MILYGVQQQLAQLQMELEKSHDRRSQAAAARLQLEEELNGLKLTYRKVCQNTDDERKKGDWGSPCNIALILALYEEMNLNTSQALDFRER